MNGKRFFEAMEAAHSGFLRSAYQAVAPEYTTHNDQRVADSLAQVAAAMGCARLTGDMVQEARLALGLKARTILPSGTHPAAANPTPPAPLHLPALPVVQPELFPTPGERRIAEALEDAVRALWAIRAAIAGKHYEAVPESEGRAA